MKYTKEELSTTKLKIAVSVEAEEINAAISAAVKMQQQGITLAGFRKGHVPESLIEKRFKGPIYADAARDLVNVHLNQILAELDVIPCTGINVDPTPLPIERDKGAEYTAEFEHMPVFDLPDYEGMEINQTRATEVSDKQMEAFLTRMSMEGAHLVPVDSDGPAEDGQYVNIDLTVTVDGKVESDAHGMDYEVGQAGTMPELDAFIKTLKVNQEGETEITFPEDFFQASLQGKTATIKVHVYAIKKLSRKSIEDLVNQFKLKDEAELRARAAEVILSQVNKLYRDEAQTALLQTLLDKVDFELPQVLVDNELNVFVEREQGKAMRVGKALSAEQIAEVREKNLETARKNVKTYILLLAVSKKEGLEVTERELQTQIGFIAQQMRDVNNKPVNPQDLYKLYAENGTLYTIRDEILINKAMQAVYAKAKVTMVAPKSEAEAAAEAPAEEAKPAE